jgi:hypothetical protein
VRDLAEPPAFECQAVPDHGPAADGPTLAYMLATREPFEDLRQVVTQIAAFLILAAAKSNGWRDHPMIDATLAGFGRVSDAIRAVAVPNRAQHVHSHLVKAETHVATALNIIAKHRARFDDNALDAALGAIQAAQREMQWSSAAVPGLEMIAFSQGCCAMHRNQTLIKA